MVREVNIHISDRSHFNLMLNVYNCGNKTIKDSEAARPDSYIFYYVNEGKGSVVQSGISHKIHAGQGFVIWSNAAYEIKAERNKILNVSWAAFSGYLVDSYLTRANLSIYEPVFDDVAERELGNLFDQLIRISQTLPNRYCRLMARMYEIFAFLLDNVRVDTTSAIGTAEYHLIRALDFIDANFRDSISIEDIADIVGVSRKRLYTVFKTLTGFSPKDYIIYYRLNEAVKLLQYPDLSIESISSSVGYSNQFYFSKEFKKNVGMTPTEYRRAFMENPDMAGYESPIHRVRECFPNAARKKTPEH